jgi:hypothetical protein
VLARCSLDLGSAVIVLLLLTAEEDESEPLLKLRLKIVCIPVTLGDAGGLWGGDVAGDEGLLHVFKLPS